MQVAFLLPPGSSAGGAYARRMAAALTGGSHAAIVLEAGDPVAALASMPPPCAAVVDGMLLPALAARPEAARVVALVHRLGDAGDDMRQALRAVPCVVATSGDVASQLGQAGVDPARVALVTPAADDAPRGTGSGGPGCAVLSVGAITARKGHEATLRALARLHDLDWTLCIAGDARRDPSHPPALLALAEELGVAARLRLVSDPADAALDALWAGADVFALPSRWEGYPTGVAQALRRGLPVATTAQGAALMPVEAGITVPVDDVVQLSNGLRRMIFDAALRADMADAAWKAGQALPRWADQARALTMVLGKER